MNVQNKSESNLKKIDWAGTHHRRFICLAIKTPVCNTARPALLSADHQIIFYATNDKIPTPTQILSWREPEPGCRVRYLVSWICMPGAFVSLTNTIDHGFPA